MERQQITALESLPLVLRVGDLAPLLAIGKAAAYDLVRCGKIRSIRVGRNILIPRSAFEEFLDQAGT